MVLDITQQEFDYLKNLMYTRTGVHLKETKKPLIISRLQKRLWALHLSDFSQYIPLLENPGGEELRIFINAITTNETYFFRHPKQFNYLYEVILPNIIRDKNGVVRIWSAACSSGEEPYSLVITCQEFLKGHPSFSGQFFASDVNSEMIASAEEAVYSPRRLQSTPESIRTKYFQVLESKDPRVEMKYKVKDEFKKKVTFRCHNLLKPFPEKNLDLIFVRNVLIYFDRESRQKVIDNLQGNLRLGGYLFVSLSEDLRDLKSHLKFVETGIYQRV